MKTAAGPSQTGGKGWLIAGALGYGFFLWLLLPRGVVAIDDDFGYLRSVVATIQQRRPWTDAWLEPWSASFSLLAAGLFFLTHHFSFAVQGLLTACAAAAFAGVALLLQQRHVSGKQAWVLTALTLTFPTVLWKSAEFTGVALYFPCLLWAVWAAGEKRWGAFFCIWVVAVATRQSALAWLVIPLWSAGRSVVWGTGAEKDNRERWRAFAVVAGGLLVFWALHRGMNRTHAQALLTEGAFSRLDARAGLQVCIVGAVVYLAATGCGRFLLLGQKVPVPPPRQPAAATRWKLALGGMLFLVGLVLDERQWVQQEHALFAGAFGWIYTKIILALAIAGWLQPGFRLRLEHGLFAAASLAAVAVRGTLWDYYLLDVAVFGLFAVVADARSVATAEPPPKTPSAARFWPVALLAAFHLGFFLELKSTLDRAYALCLLSENALRAGGLQPAELSFAPFGFTAWHLFPYYAAHEGKASTDLAGFRDYLRTGAVEVGQGYSRALHVLPRFRHVPPADRHTVIASDTFTHLWFFKAEFFLLRFKTEAEQTAALALPPSTDAFSPPFPLNDDEWRQLIERKNAP